METPLIAGLSDSELLLRLADLVLLVGLAEIALVLGLQRRRPALARLLPMLLAGFGLALALRLALGGAGVAWVAPCLLLAGVAHLLELKLRWRHDLGERLAIDDSPNPTHPRPSGQGRPS